MAISNGTAITYCPNMETDRINHCVAASGTNVTIAGGKTAAGSYPDRVESYSTSFVKTILAPLDSPGILSGAGTGSGAVFTCHRSELDAVTPYTVAYDKNLVQTSASPPSKERSYSSGTSFGKEAVFAGGYNPSGNTYFGEIDIYDQNLVLKDPVTLPVQRIRLMPIQCGNMLLVAGGTGGAGYQKDVFAYKYQ
mgnify:CR=1 FL=1